MTMHAHIDHSAVMARGPRPASLWARLVSAWQRRAERVRAAAELNAMSDRELRDMGLTRTDIALGFDGAICRD
jgi:uncharacterized protein YjiS (DUF1127 family)